MTIVDSLFVIFSYFIGICAAIHALLKTREPRSALIWVAICLFVPLLGSMAYAIFGVNRVRKVTQSLHSYGTTLFFDEEEEPEHKLLSQNIPAKYKTSIESGDRLLKRHIKTGCKVTPLFDAKEAYPAMIEAIKNAEDSIFLMSYIFSSQGMGKEIIDALQEAVKRKIEVKVLIDGIGNFYSRPSTYRLLKKLQIPVRLFLSPLQSFRGLLFLNMRNHAKIMVVDGKIGFTGGMNIRDEGEMHDLHFCCEGAIVGALQDVFLNLWYFAKRENEHPRLLFYDDSIKGNALVRAIDNGPYQHYPHIVLRLIQGLNDAQKHIRIMTPYFVVGNALVSALISARLRGVQVEVILPEENNLSFVKGATEATLPALLRFGIQFYYRQGVFAHNKVVVIDHDYVCLGSSNLDTRSFLLNFEFNLEVYDAELAKVLITDFEVVKQSSRLITQAWLRKKGFFVTLRNALCRLFSPYL